VEWELHELLVVKGNWTHDIKDNLVSKLFLLSEFQLVVAKFSLKDS